MRGKLRRVVWWVAVGLFVVTLAAIPLSFVGTALWNSSNTEPVVTFRISRGVLSFKHWGDAKGARVFQPNLQRGWRFWWAKDEPNPFEWQWMPVWEASLAPTGPMLVLRAPMWIPAAVLGAPLGVGWWRRARRRVPGQCRGCGYDLAGLGAGVAGITCPECGRLARGEAANMGSPLKQAVNDMAQH